MTQAAELDESGIEDIYPLSPLQQGMLFHSVASGNARAYVSQLALELTGSLDRSSLRQAWSDLIARHGVLRTAFEWEGLDAPVQVVHREVELPWFEHDMRHLPEATKNLELGKLLEADRIRGFDLAQAPALRVHLVQLEDDRSALVFTFHHILLDGWSTPILIGELIELYRAKLQGRRAALSDARPYSEYIAWIDEHDSGTTERYWRELLSGAEPTSLSIDRSGTEGIEAPGEVASADEKLVLDRALSGEVMTIGRALGVPTSTVVQAAWAVLLARYTGRRDVVYGVTLHGRPEDLPESEGRVGLFINTLPVRVKLRPELTARELVVALRVQQAELFRHQHTPLSRIVGWSDLPRGQRLFETVVGYQGYPVDAAHRAPMPGLSVRVLAMSDRGNYPATLLVTPGDEIELLLCYVPERLDRGAVRRLLLQLRELLRAIVSAPDARLDDIELTTPAERQASIRFANGAARDYPERECAHRLFSARARTTPLATAVSHYEARLSYGELERRANQLAHRLVQLGVGPETRVAICLPRGTDLVVSMLGVLKAGGAYVPLDPTYPRQRLLHILHDCGARLLVSTSAQADALPTDAVDQLLLDQQDFGDCPTHDPDVAVGPRNLAYVIYTSGSTGRPKGVLLEHGGLVNTTLAQIETFSITHESVVLQFASPSFDASVSEIFTALIAGATLELRDSRDLYPGPDLVEMMRSRRVSVVTFPPSALAVLPEAPLAELRTLVVAGEACPGELVRRWAPGRDFINAYGPTEVTICASAGRCPPTATRPLIGRPIANVAAYVLDQELRLVPQGVPGELYVGGPGVARGYQALPELTAERFVPSPFRAGERLYRTGDRARVTESGELDFLGRRDEQIKLRGYRIELGEIEAVLETAPEVARAVAIVRNEPPAARIVAYVVPKSGQSISREALSERLRRELPEYMVPTAIVELAELPTTPSGKLDKAALPAPERPLSSAEHSPPRTPAEAVLAKIWSEVLRVERVGIFDDFFALGGDSLLSMQIVSRARERGLRLGVSDIFEHPTIAALSVCAANARGAPAADQGIVSGELTPSPIQRWLLETPEAVPRHFNMSLFFQTSEALDVEVARKALRTLVTHHDALRLVFDGDRARHRSPDTIDARELCIVHDFAELADGELSAAISAEASAVQSGFDLARGPLIRLAVFDAGRGRPQRVLWAVHHLVTDAVSMRILLEDFQRAYQALLHGEEPELPLKTSSFKDHCAAVWELAASEDVGAELAYWTTELSRPVARLPLDHRLGENDVASSAEVTLTLDAESTLRLTRGLSRRSRITEVLLAAWARAQTDYAGGSAIAVQLEMHGRDVVPGADVSRTVGWFTSFHPVVLRPSASRDPAADLEHAVRQLRAVPRAGAGFLWLRQSSGAAGEALRSLGLPEVSFNYLGQSSALAAAAGSVSLAPEAAGNERDPSAIRSQLIEVNAIVVADRLQATLRYSENLHGRETIEQIARAFERELRALGELADGDDLGAPIEDEALAGVERIPLAPRDVPLPLSFGQERAWFLEQLDPGRVAYHCPFVARIRGAIDEAILRRAFEVVVRRHDGLRTTFPLVDGRAVQVVSTTSDAALEVFDLRDLAAHEREPEARRIVERQLHRPFDLSRGPLIRAGIVQSSDDDAALYIDVHLVTCDRTTMGILVHELMLAYDAIRQGRAPSLPPLRIHYPDYAHWQRGRLQGAALEALLGFWQRELGDTPALELPADRPRPPTPLGRGARHTVTWDATLMRQIKSMGAQSGLTFYMTLLAAFETLLHRLSGQESFAVGTPTANRDQPELEGVVGYFSSLLVFRADFAGAPSFREVMQRVRARCLAAYAHQELPFERIVEAIAPERDPSRNPIFQVMLALQQIESRSVELPGIRLEFPDTADHTTAQFDLRVDILETPEALTASFEYSTELFDADTVARWTRSFELLLRTAVRAPETKVSELPLIDAAERHLLLDVWNDTAAEFPRDKCLHEPFLDSAARAPEAEAVVGPGARLDYAGLAARVHHLAHELAQRGVGPERLVGVLMRKGVEQVIATLAILEAGGAYLPLDPALPPARLLELAERAGAIGIIAQPKHVDRVTWPESLFLRVLDEGFSSAPGEPRPPLAARQRPEQLAYVIYTSGSTGVPKGVALDGRGPINTLHDINTRFGVGPGDRVLFLSSLSFDLSVYDIFGTLGAGGTVIVPDAERERDPAHWVEQVAREKVTIWNSVPALFELFVEQLEQGNAGDVSSLRLALLSGDWIPVTLADRARRVIPGIQLESLGGATEASVWSISYPIGAVDPNWRSIPYGKPLKNQKFFVLDASLEPCPVGVAGELYIGGIGLALGYYNDPERTAESFFLHPKTGERLYRTGDHGRYLPSGDIEFLGRRDGQVKLRGYRVELGEIEAALRRHSKVKEALVLVRPDARGERRLVAYVVGEEASAAELTEHLGSILPAYMVASAFVMLEAFPLTANGKVDRKALPEPSAISESERAYDPPRGAVEEVIASIWAELFGLTRVGRDEHFFELGGHSILGTQAVARMRAALKAELPLRWIFEAPTVRAMAARVSELLERRQGLVAPTLGHVPRNSGLALSFAQERALFLDRMLPGDPLHVQALTLDMVGELDTATLEQALGDLALRHPSLCTTISMDGAHAIQAIGQTMPELEHVSQFDDWRPSALDGRLVRVQLLERSANRYELRLVAHRVALDAGSLELAVRELFAIYAGRRKGQRHPLAPLSTRVVDLAQWERRLVEAPAFTAKLDAYAKRLRDVPPLELPTDHTRPAIQSFSGASVPLVLGGDVSEALSALARREGAPLFAVLCALTEVLLARHSGQSDFAIGTSSAHARTEAVGLAGTLENLIALRADGRSDVTFRELVRSARDRTLEAYLDKDVPFEKLVEQIAPERDTSRHALFQAALTLRSAAPRKFEAEELQVELHAPDDHVSTFDLSIEITDDARGIEGKLVYKSALFERGGIERLARRFEQLMASAIATPDAPAHRLDLIPAAERVHVERTFAASTEPVGEFVSLTQRIQERARQAGDAKAFEQRGRSLSYRELTDRTGRIAAGLRQRGVGSEELVGVCLGRTLDLPTALLGVLTAGAAYLPLDPTEPDDRLEYMIRDSGVRYVVTDSTTSDRIRNAGAEPLPIDELAASHGSRVVVACLPDQLAYVIYTSGSTGRPKGVEVTHGGLDNFLQTMCRSPGITARDRLLAVTSPAFDIAALELYLPLWVGATVLLAPSDVVSDGEQLLEALAAATIIQATPATYRMLLAAGWRRLPGPERHLLALTGGEALAPSLATALSERVRSLWNVYGPTETTIWSTRAEISADAARAPTIGRPLAQTRTYVVDRHFEPVPIGVWGELLIGGAGVARGYRGREELTAERFVPDPIGGIHGARVYRTGDRCRWLSDGTLEFGGRFDHQIKLRGHRIELGEIEAVLSEHPGVGSAAVIVREDAGDPRLVGYVVPADETAPQRTNDGVARWRHVWDGLYEHAEAQPDLDSSGYVSSYTREPIPTDQMREWLDETIVHARASGPMRRVLELGCGTGMVIGRLAATSERYVGCDQSAVALERARQSMPVGANVELLQRPAHDLSGFVPGAFDTIILNSVVQYFPSVDYLLEVLQKAIDCVAAGGRIFIGDVRSRSLLTPFAWSVEVHDSAPSMPILELSARARSRARFEPELAIDPELFLGLAGSSARPMQVRFRRKITHAENELTLYRYDVVLELDASRTTAPSAPIVAFSDCDNEADLQELLLRDKPEALILRDIIDPRLGEPLFAMRACDGDAPRNVAELLARMRRTTISGIAPIRLQALATELGYHLETAPSERHGEGLFDALLTRPDASLAPLFPLETITVTRPKAGFATDPERAERERGLAHEFRGFLETRLPEYMLPAAYVLMDALPLTTSGKVNRNALPAPSRIASETTYIAPRTATEEAVARIFGDVLRLERISADADFFALGGHSLLGTHVVTLIRQTLKADLPLGALFAHPTIGGLATQVDALLAAGKTFSDTPIAKALAQPALPLSYAQERMYFMHKLYGGAGVFNIPQHLRLLGPLDLPALRRAFDELTQRHEALRTVIREVDGVPLQIILPDVQLLEREIEDISALPQAERESRLLELGNAHASRSFDLEQGPLVHARVLKLRPDEHVLLVTMHHIVADGWSLGVLYTELSALYAAFSAGKPSPLAPLELQYADYAVWQRQWMQGDVLEQHVAWWKQRLLGAERLELPTDRPRPATRDIAGDSVDSTVDRVTTGRLRAICQENGATLFMGLLAAFQALMHRYSGQDDIVVGTAIANRTRSEIGGLIGFFINTPAMRTDLGGNPSFHELLLRVKANALEVYDWQDAPFERIVEALHPVRDPARYPIYDVMFGLQNAPGGTLTRSSGVALRGIQAHTGFARYDLTVQVIDLNETLALDFEYALALFDASTARRLARHFTSLLEALCATPERGVDDADYLLDGERQALESFARPVATARLESDTIHGRIERVASANPSAVAIVDPDGTELSYGELVSRARSLAHELVALDIGVESRVAIAIDRGQSFVVAMLATLAAGAAYVPLDPGLPAERLCLLARDSGASLLITHSSLSERLPSFGLPVVLVDAERRASRPLVPAVTSSTAAYVIYTSGSTGTPKGVVVQHASAIAIVRELVRDLGVGPSSQVLQYTPLSFDVSVSEILMALFAGGTLHFAARDELIPSQELVELLERRRIDTLSMTASALERLPRAELPTLQTLVVGGEPCAPETLAYWAKGRRVVVAYGPTEATITATLGATSGDHSHATLGRPLAGVAAFVLDRRMQLVPTGVYGELHLGGRGITRGYHGRPDLTAERFVPNPFAQSAGERMYRTGDRVRWREDGTLEFAGRLDGQVKIRGFRIELGEVEAALSAVPGIRQAAVIVRRERDDKRLVAYFTADDSLDASQLRAALEARLPAPYVPSAFFQLDELPQGPTGKLDKKALLQISATTTDDVAAPPRTPTEEIVCGLYADLLRIERVGVTSSFFDLGGHSLLATQLVSRLRELFRIDLPLRAVFESPTPEGLAARVDHESARGASSRPLLTPQPRPELIPLSFAQERLWFLHQLEPRSAVYNTPYVVRTGATVDEAALERALERLIGRHESLRTSFPNIDGNPAQRIHEHPVFELRSIDIDPADDRRLQRVLLDESLEPFAIEERPPLRILLVRLGTADSVICLTLHHIITDLFSMNVIAGELIELYREALAGAATRFLPLELQYADYALWQRSWLDPQTLDCELALWKDRLEGLQPLALPTDRPRPAYPSHRGATVPVPISAELGAALLELARREGVTPFMALLALFSAVLGRHADQEQFGIGFPISGRTDQKLEPLIGFFVNTLVARVDLSGRPSFRDLLARVRDETLWAYAHQEVPFAKIVEAAAPERSTGTSPLFQAVVTFDHVTDPVEQSTPELELGLAKVDLALSAVETRGVLSAVLEYSQDLFDRERIERLARQLVTLAEAAVAEPERAIAELPLLGNAERHAIISDFNPPAQRLDGADRALNELVLARARELGTEPALVGPNGERFSYTELADQVRRRAAGLRARGVGPESIVALAMRRSPEIVIAMLAVLEAGGAYLPLDPSYPRARLEFMLADSRASLVITDGRGEAVVSNLVHFDALATDPAPATTAAHPDQAAYVIYTSGSTGVPKGVVVTHRGIVNTALAEAEALGLARGSRVAPVASPSFDAFGWEIYAALISGATLHFGSAEDIQPGQPFSDFLKRERIEVLSVVPSMLSVLPDPETLALDVLVVGGEVAPRELLARFSKRTRVFNSYGPTETAICATLARIEHGARVTLGRPLANVRTHVVDALLEPVPVGVFGELLIGGAGLSRGYLDRPELTAERFVPDPFSIEPGARLYRTGDRACYLPDGELEFGGRLDDQIKLRGYRIELGEIERALAAVPRVRTAVVALREDRAGPEIAAYVVLDEPQPSRAVLLSELATRLPAHMLPSRVTVLPELPRTSTGKIDRRALAAIDLTPEHAVALPRSPLEASLSELYSELLRCADIGVDQGFFELGGHSLLAVRLKAELGRRHGFHPQLSELFNSRLTITDLAAMIEGREVQPSLLVPLNSGHDGTPIFAIHSGATTVLGYTPLAAELGAPVFGLRPPGTVDSESIPESLELLAADYASAIEAQQPSGPVNLIAHSLGGFIALDVARELQRRGRALGLVALLDTLWPFDDEPLEPSDDELHQELTGEPLGEGSVEQKRRRLRLVAERAALLPPGLAETELDRHWGVLTAIRRLVGRRIRSMDGVGPLWKRIARQGFEGVVTAIRRLAGRRIRPMDGVLHRIVLLEARDRNGQHARYEHSRQLWKRIARHGLEIERVPGNHYSLLRPPHAASVARIVMRRLERTKGQVE